MGEPARLGAHLRAHDGGAGQLATRSVRARSCGYVGRRHLDKHDGWIIMMVGWLDKHDGWIIMMVGWLVNYDGLIIMAQGGGQLAA